MESGSSKGRAWLKVVAAIAIGLVALAWLKSGALLQARVVRAIAAGPLIARDAAGEAVLATLLTYEQPKWNRRSSGSGGREIVELQLNRMSDAANLARIVVHRSGARDPGVYLLGAEPDRIWVFAGGVRAFSIARRELELDAAAIETRVPQLKDQLPDDRKFYDFDAESGLRVTTRDGTRLILDTRTWTIAPQPEATPNQPTRDAQEWERSVQEWGARTDEGTATTVAQLPGEFGLDSWRSGERWFGILSAGEQRQYARSWDRPRRHESVDPERRKVWTAPVTDSGPGRSQLGEMQAVRDNTYLRGGFLRDGKRMRPVQAKGSPDLIIEHYTAIDDSAQMLLTRITPEGEVRWSTILPIKLPNTVCATDEYVAFRGLPPRTASLQRAQLVSVKLSDGSFRAFEYN